MPPTRKTSLTLKKAQKCKYLTAGSSKITELKNKNCKIVSALTFIFMS